MNKQTNKQTKQTNKFLKGKGQSRMPHFGMQTLDRSVNYIPKFWPPIPPLMIIPNRWVQIFLGSQIWCTEMVITHFILNMHDSSFIPFTSNSIRRIIYILEDRSNCFLNSLLLLGARRKELWGKKALQRMTRMFSFDI